jgi:hypothetical protein
MRVRRVASIFFLSLFGCYVVLTCWPTRNYRWSIRSYQFASSDGSKWFEIKPDRAYLRFAIAEADPSALDRRREKPKSVGLFRYGNYGLSSQKRPLIGGVTSGPSEVKYVDIPVVVIIVCLLAFPAYVRGSDYYRSWILRQAAERVARGHCPKCDYDMRGLNRCPECGAIGKISVGGHRRLS